MLKSLKNCLGNQVYLGHGKTFVSKSPLLDASDLEKVGITYKNFDYENVVTLYDVNEKYITVQMHDGSKKEVKITDKIRVI